MADKHTTTTHKTFGSRLGDSFKGIITGIVMVVVGITALIWNEGRSVKTLGEIENSENDVISVDSASVNPANDNKLVHFYGRAVTDAVLTDDVFSIALTNQLQLIRSSEMYQWKESSKKETKKNLGGSEDVTVTYTYSTGWDSDLEVSEEFNQPEGHTNPNAFRYPSQKNIADNVKIGAYMIPKEFVSKIGNPIEISMGVSTNRLIPAGIATNAIVMESGWYIPGPLNGTPEAPKVGDERIAFSYVPSSDATFIAVQLGSTIANSSPKYGKVRQKNGICTTEEIFTSDRKANSFFTWIIRLLGFILIFAGFKTVLNPIRVLADVVPFIGKIVGIGTGLISFISAMVVAFLTIAISWLAYRPMISVPLLIAAVALIVFIVFKVKKSAVKQA